MTLRMTEEAVLRHRHRIGADDYRAEAAELPTAVAGAFNGISFFVPGEPQGKASPRAGSVPIESIIAAYEQTGSVYKAGKIVGIQGSSLHERLKRAGFTLPDKRFTEAEIERIKDEYQAAADAYRLDDLAKAMGRTKTGICTLARRLGMTNQSRKMPADKAALVSVRAKARIEKNGHPRGALGMKHSHETKAIMSMKSSQMWADPASKVNADEHRQRLSDRCVQMTLDREKPVGYSRSAGGRRPDLGDTYFRSSWEANYARYLNLLVQQKQIAHWEFECTTFVFETIKRGTRTYTPDFRVEFSDGRHEWHEVKGWMDAKSKTRLSRMATHFPTEKVVIIDQAWFKSALAKGLPSMLKHWEFKGKRIGAVKKAVS